MISRVGFLIRASRMHPPMYPVAPVLRNHYSLLSCVKSGLAYMNTLLVILNSILDG